MAFKAGSVVKLKSGGPKMTVIEIGVDAMTEKEFVSCVWFDGPEKLQANFAPGTLEAAKGGFGDHPQVKTKKPK